MVSGVGRNALMKDRVQSGKEGIWLDVVSFIGCLCLAYFLKWKTTDLVWSLWLGSLVIGYLTILSTIGAGVGSAHLMAQKEPGSKVMIMAGGIGGSLFLLAFFTVHFGMFHFVHGMFLSQFFPLDGADPGIMPMGNPLSVFGMLFKELFPLYGLFLIPAMISQRFDLLRPWKMTQDFSDMGNQGGEPRPFDKKKGNDLMVAPYKNVVRMHILIFFFAAVHLLKLENFLVYAVVYTVYFFPWRIFKKDKKR